MKISRIVIVSSLWGLEHQMTHLSPNNGLLPVSTKCLIRASPLALPKRVFQAPTASNDPSVSQIMDFRLRASSAEFMHPPLALLKRVFQAPTLIMCLPSHCTMFRPFIE
ncbi:hypothetical protein CEXT_20471 [Caerostris extrusa]|uniref:Uncharacterized protein n=1 Tax=Caerostris extrusa TaxID=172846 RepID=A0AAV4WW59_CAEEX|nr:hypothetical protein CEXT_20471 [Caerostris extrusa]